MAITVNVINTLPLPKYTDPFDITLEFKITIVTVQTKITIVLTDLLVNTLGIYSSKNTPKTK